MRALSSFLLITALSLNVSFAQTQDTNTINLLAPALSKALEQGASRSCIPVTLSIQGTSERDQKPFFFSTNIASLPDMVKKVSRNNKFSSHQLNGFFRIHKTALLSQTQGTGFSEQSLVQIAEQLGFKVQAKLVCIETYTLTVDP